MHKNLLPAPAPIPSFWCCLCLVYHTFWWRICLRRPDLQLLCAFRHLVSAHACTCHALQRYLFAYGMRFARKHEVYDYRSYNNAFYGKFAPVFSNLFEVLYICVMCVAPAVAFATGGATLSTLTGLPYLLCTLIIGIFIFIVAIFGTDLVRRVASVLSICIIAGLLIVYIPNIIHGWSAIRATAQQMTTSTQPFGKALYSAFLYGTFQLANIAVFVQHTKVFKNRAMQSKAWGLALSSTR